VSALLHQRRRVWWLPLDDGDRARFGVGFESGYDDGGGRRNGDAESEDHERER
jgi:hypothetical protein